MCVNKLRLTTQSVSYGCVMLLHNDAVVANARLRTEEVQHFHQIFSNWDSRTSVIGVNRKYKWFPSQYFMLT